MKDIADMGELAPSVLSSLYSTVLPAYFREAERKSCDEALDKACFWSIIYPSAAFCLFAGPVV